jgi:hypothetical protein
MSQQSFIHPRPVWISTILVLYLSATMLAPAILSAELRPPAVPLVTHDPYFSVWSLDDRLTDGFTRHWTGSIHGMWGVVRIDGKPFRFLGLQPTDGNSRRQVGYQDVPTPMKQTKMELVFLPFCEISTTANKHESTGTDSDLEGTLCVSAVRFCVRSVQRQAEKARLIRVFSRSFAVDSCPSHPWRPPANIR